MSGAYRRYHQQLFEWHCETFFPFDERLTWAELDYFEACFSLAEGYVEPTRTGYAQLSYYSYSHRIDGGQVDSSRVAMGTLAHPDEAWAAAQPVLHERGIDGSAARPQGALFYGLGWSVLARDFKVYFWVPDVHALPERLAVLARPHALDVRAEGLISFTYQDGRVSEEKVYLYPNTRTALGHRTMMVTTGRGVVGQHDVEENEDAWLARLSERGRDIVEKYEDVGESLDTIAFQDAEHCTLYFP